MLELDDIAEIVAGAINEAAASLRAVIEALSAENKALTDRIAVLEARDMPAVIEPDMAAIRAEVDEKVASAVSCAFATIPVPQDGKSADMAEVRRMVADAVSEGLGDLDVEARIGALSEQTEAQLETLSRQIDGLTDIRAQLDANASIIKSLGDEMAALPRAEAKDADAVKRLIAEEVVVAVSTLPAPKDGKSVDPAEVERMVAERVSAAVGALPPAKDGVGLANAIKDQNGHLVLVMTDGTTKDMGRIDGETFTLDDFDIIPIDERSIKLCFTRGDTMHSFELSFPVPLDAGVWREGGEYVKGDGVTWAGSYWIAQRDAPGKPDTPDGGWRLAVKRGRDAK